MGATGGLACSAEAVDCEGNKAEKLLDDEEDIEIYIIKDDKNKVIFDDEVRAQIDPGAKASVTNLLSLLPCKNVWCYN